MTPQNYFLEARDEAAELLEAVGNDDKLLLKTLTARRARWYLTALVALTEKAKAA